LDSGNIAEAFQLLVKICKERKYLKLQQAIHDSYLDLISVEAEARRKKSSSLIKGMQAIDRNMVLLNHEYEKVKRDFQINAIPYFDQFISEISQERKKLALLKDRLK